MTKRFIITTTASVLVAGTIAGIVATSNNPSKTGADTSPVVQQLSNHEARIKNAESNIKDLQAKTGTPTSSSQVDVPVAPSSTDLAAATAPTTSTSATSADTPSAPATPTVVSYREIPLDADNSDCEYTYSDNTTYRFAWKRTNEQGAWVTDGAGQNGHWVKSTQTNGYCDDKAIGRPKA